MCVQLPPEILSMIITDYTNSLEDRRPIRHLLLVSRSFYSIYTPILYESLYLTESSKINIEKHDPSTILTPPRLSHLHVVLLGNTSLSKLVHTFSFSDNVQQNLVQSDLVTFKAIFSSLTNLTRLCIPPLMAAPSRPLEALPETTQLSHLTCGSPYFPSFLDHFLPTQPSLRYLSCAQLHFDDHRHVFSRRFCGLPNLHTIHCDGAAFGRIRLTQYPAIEHVVMNSSAMLWPIDNGDMLRRLRTFHFSCYPNERLFELMRNLERVEFLGIELLGKVAVIRLQLAEDFALRGLLDVPSKDLKYISLRSTQLYEDVVTAERLFDAHRNLRIVDIRPITPEASEIEFKFIVDRVSQPKVFESWWEVGEIRGDVEEASVNGMAYFERYCRHR
ncbi:hypothetical protein ONZ45_g10350 [Pleurotus djamor]|nr:hypothetical protein ONZ45_g10350 [Pleurotus djamor]